MRLLSPGPPSSATEPLDAGSAAEEVALAVGGRLADPAVRATAATRMAEQTSFPLIQRWRPASLLLGDAGLAAMCGELARRDPTGGWDAAGHELLARAVADCAVGDSVGLADGAAGVAACAWLLSRSGRRYVRLRAQLGARLRPAALRSARSCAAGAVPVPTPVHDLFSGLTGLGAWLSLDPDADAGADAGEELGVLVEALAVLLGEQGGLPRLFTPAEALPDPARELAPHGLVDLGVAHGLPGVMALLAILRRGAPGPAPAADDALRRAADLVAAHVVRAADGPTWPRVLIRTAGGDWVPGQLNRPGWCYGTPGVARSLWLAGAALGDDRLSTVALEATAAACRPGQLDRLPAPTLCHGLAGLLTIIMQVARDTGDSTFSGPAGAVLDRLLDAYDPRLPLGYQDLEVTGARVDNPGLLNGAAGVVLALLAAGAAEPPAWTRLLLVA